MASESPSKSKFIQIAAGATTEADRLLYTDGLPAGMTLVAPATVTAADLLVAASVLQEIANEAQDGKANS